MFEVKVIDGNVEKALQILKRKVKDSRLFIELREREQYRKPSEVKRAKKARAKIREKYRVVEQRNSRG